MIYQKLLVGKQPYLVGKGHMIPFGDHRHSELEFSYCLEGGYWIVIDKKEYYLEPGDLAIIGSMISHSIPDKVQSDRLGLTMEVGPIFLMGCFELFSKAIPGCLIFRLKKEAVNSPELLAVRELLDETAELLQNNAAYSELMIRSNLYNICARILKTALQEGSGSSNSKASRDVAKIEEALEIIHDRYADPITVEYVAGVCGYSKSNFCKIFKHITGDTFHNVLNQHRVENACFFLKNSNLSVEDIAVQVGFADSKSFCRVFKNMTEKTPGVYRKENIQS